MKNKSKERLERRKRWKTKKYLKEKNGRKKEANKGWNEGK